MKIKCSFGEFITFYDKSDKEIITIQSDDIKNTLKNIFILLDYCDIKYIYEED